MMMEANQMMMVTQRLKASQSFHRNIPWGHMSTWNTVKYFILPQSLTSDGNEVVLAVPT
jgi:hypothetical protein